MVKEPASAYPAIRDLPKSTHLDFLMIAQTNTRWQKVYETLCHISGASCASLTMTLDICESSAKFGHVIKREEVWAEGDERYGRSAVGIDRGTQHIVKETPSATKRLEGNSSTRFLHPQLDVGKW